MAKKNRREAKASGKKREDRSSAGAPTGGLSAMGAAFALAGFDAPSAAQAEQEPPARDERPPTQTGALDWRALGKVSVQIERKGRGGKTVTVVRGLALFGERLAEAAKLLQKRLGCGGVVEGDAVVLQGDQRERASQALEALGVRRVSRG